MNGASRFLISCVSPFLAPSLQALQSPEMAGQATSRPGPDAFPVEVLQPPCHVLGREGLRGVVNQIGPRRMVYELQGSGICKIEKAIDFRVQQEQCCSMRRMDAGLDDLT